MKWIAIVLLGCAVFTSHLLGNNPWNEFDNNTEYNTVDKDKDKDKPPKHPVPEPSTYGIVLTGSALAVVLLRKKFRSK